MSKIILVPEIKPSQENIRIGRKAARQILGSGNPVVIGQNVARNILRSTGAAKRAGSGKQSSGNSQNGA